MENFVNDIQELEQVRHFLIKASTSNNADTINACNGLALEKLNKHIETKIRIVSQFEESEGEKWALLSVLIVKVQIFISIITNI